MKRIATKYFSINNEEKINQSIDKLQDKSEKVSE
jgi:hypothetical protein